MKGKMLLYSLIFFAYFAIGSEVDGTLEPETIYHHDLGQPNILRNYEIAVISRAVALSTSKYGPINLKQVEQEITVNRVAAELDKAISIHIEVDVNTNVPPKFNIELLEIGLYRNLLGLRKAVIKRSRRKDFEKLSTKADIQALSIGQAENWLDNRIYRNAGINVKESSKYSSLVPMLATGRFDLLPLGIIEIESAIKAYPTHVPRVEILENFYIYYPMTTYLHVSGRYPRLVARMREGFDILKNTGEMDVLFREHFGDILSTIDREKATLVIFNNPENSPSDNFRLTKATIKRFFSSQTKIIDMRTSQKK